MPTNRLTYDSAALYPESRTQRLIQRELQGDALQAFKVQVPRREPIPRATRESNRQAAIRKDLDRGLPDVAIMALYHVSQIEVDRARKAGW